jgi:hypothetical protein
MRMRLELGSSTLELSRSESRLIRASTANQRRNIVLQAAPQTSKSRTQTEQNRTRPNNIVQDRPKHRTLSTRIKPEQPEKTRKYLKENQPPEHNDPQQNTGDSRLNPFFSRPENNSAEKPESADRQQDLHPPVGALSCPGAHQAR